MNGRRALLAVLLTGAAGTAAACELPALVVIPAAGVDGDTAQHIVAAQRYIAGIDKFTVCTRAELAAAGGDAAPESLRTVLIRRNNHAVAEARAVMALFAERVASVEELYLAEFIAGEGQECIAHSRRLMTGVVDDHAVLFVDGSGRTYLNVLEAACTDLARFGHFDVRTGRISVASPLVGPEQRNRVCSNEFILPYAFENASLQSRECALGRFFELTPEKAERLNALRAASTQSAANPAEATPAPARDAQPPPD